MEIKLLHVSSRKVIVISILVNSIDDDDKDVVDDDNIIDYRYDSCFNNYMIN